MIFMVGMQTLGISLAALSVFGGALGVGVGFGLQKIASNFISGIILLSEKSIEVGDVIELSDGTIGTIKEITQRMTEEAFESKKPLIIGTGGFASLFDRAGIFDVQVPDLVLKGLHVALKMNAEPAGKSGRSTVSLAL